VKSRRHENGAGATPTFGRRRRAGQLRSAAAAASAKCRRRRRGGGGAQLYLCTLGITAVLYFSMIKHSATKVSADALNSVQ